MSSLFGGGKMPAPQPVPPTPVDDTAQTQARLDAERTAIADQKARGRASTIKAGGDIAAEEQYGRGLLKQKRRGSASQEIMG